MSMTLEGLKYSDLAARVRLRVDDAVIEGPLLAFGVESDYVKEKAIAERYSTRIPAAPTMNIQIGRWEATGVPLNTEVEFL